MKLNLTVKSLAFAAATLVLASTQAGATTIFADNFNDYQPGLTYYSQAHTGYAVGAYGTLGAWDNYGVNSVHAENRGNGDWAATLFGAAGNDPNRIVTKASFENVLGVTYTVNFESAGTTFGADSEGTDSTDRLLFSLLNADGGQSMFDYTYNPTDWSDSATNPLSMGSFSYVGTGSGNLKLSITGVSSGYRFGGSVDNVSIDAADVPEPAMLGLFGMGAIGLGLSRRRKAA